MTRIIDLNYFLKTHTRCDGWSQVCITLYFRRMRSVVQMHISRFTIAFYDTYLWSIFVESLLYLYIYPCRWLVDVVKRSADDYLQKNYAFLNICFSNYSFKTITFWILLHNSRTQHCIASYQRNYWVKRHYILISGPWPQCRAKNVLCVAILLARPVYRRPFGTTTG